MKNIVVQALTEAARNSEPVTLGLISGVKGSSPQKIGAKALFYSNGKIKGTLGGGCLEAEIQQRAIQCLRSGEPETFDLLLDHDFGWDDGLICGGKVFGLILPNAEKVGEGFWAGLAERKETAIWGVKRDFSIAGTLGTTESITTEEKPLKRLASLASSSSTPLERGVDESGAEEWRYQETVTPPCALWIAGAGHIAQAVAPLAWQLDFSVTVFDDRPALANHHFFPKAVSLRAEIWEKLLALPLPDAPSFALIVTRGHRH